MQTLELKKGIIYGPVNSRRLGRSLGINILPQKMKVCSFNCAYCQYGWNRMYASPGDDITWLDIPALEEVIEAVRIALWEQKNNKSLPRYITLSGNGEASMHPNFPEIVRSIVRLRDEISPESKTAILSNSTYINSDGVKEALMVLDERIMKLDCGYEELFVSYNKPAPGISLEDIVSGLEALSVKAPITIQTLFSAGISGNFSDENINKWIHMIRKIKPAGVQLYSISRGYPDKNLLPVNAMELGRVSEKLNSEGIKSSVY